MNFETDINWSIFTAMEKENILKAINDGDYESLCCLPEVNIDTQEKEAEIEKIIKEVKGTPVSDESKTKNDIEDFWQKGGEMTPELEKEFEKKLEDEKNGKIDDVIEKKPKDEELSAIDEKIIVEPILDQPVAIDDLNNPKGIN